MKIQKIIFSLFLFYSLPLIAEEVSGPHLEWKPIQNAHGYQLQIKDSSGKVVLNEKTDKTRIDFKLSAGNYQFRIGIMNKFRKIAVWSDWREYSILKVLAPVIENDIANMKKEDPKKDVNLQVKNIMKDAKVYLETAGKKEDITHLVQKDSSGKLQFTLEPKDMKPGEYEIIVENPLNKVSRKKFSVVEKEDIKSAKRDMKMDEDPDKKTSEKQTDPKDPKSSEESKTAKSRSAITWKSYFPGVQQIKDGEKRKGYAFLTFYLLAGKTIHELYLANKVVNEAKEDFFFKALNEPSFYLSIRMAPNSTGMIYLMNVRNQAEYKEEFNSHIKNAKIYFVLSAGVFTLNLFDIGVFSKNSNTSFQMGSRWNYQNPELVFSLTHRF